MRSIPALVMQASSHWSETTAMFARLDKYQSIRIEYSIDQSIH